jgi:hypothetical protein
MEQNPSKPEFTIAGYKWPIIMLLVAVIACGATYVALTLYKPAPAAFFPARVTVFEGHAFNPNLANCSYACPIFMSFGNRVHDAKQTPSSWLQPGEIQFVLDGIAFNATYDLRCNNTISIVYDTWRNGNNVPIWVYQGVGCTS